MDISLISAISIHIGLVYKAKRVYIYIYIYIYIYVSIYMYI